MIRWLLAVLRSFGFAFVGILTMVRTQRNAQIHLAAVVVVVTVGAILHITRLEWLAVTLITVLVLALEAVNTAIESVVDLASPQLHPLAKQAKDVAAGAVLVAALGALVVAALIVLPRL